MNGTKKNYSILMTGVEIVMIGAFFVANTFRFKRPDLLNSLASHIDDPPFATINIIIGTVIVMVAIFDIRPLIKWCYAVAAFIWTIYGLAFMLQNIEVMGHPFGRLDCWLMFAIAGRVILESWAGDD
ncbi:hypothetical protein PTW40_14220 [Lactiplantibacillus plantarum]|uniref:hypothetical protein n=1 Tax=Lactiplantibacillus plantarum TaxID=1590 RepID=UPI002379FC62|nr:hypothetical protein [Lactiplantibacillus plantarum]WDQ20857.1 hypothetical protein PTW40_14220 [Lactiplantibacillus plantarum]